MININHLRNFDRRIGPRKRKSIYSNGIQFQTSLPKTSHYSSHPLQVSESNGKHSCSPFEFTFQSDYANNNSITSSASFDQNSSIHTNNEEQGHSENHQKSQFTSIIEEENEDDETEGVDQIIHADVEVSDNSHVGKRFENTAF